MHSKPMAALAGLAMAASMASASTPIVLTFNGIDQWSGSFAALTSGATNFSLDLTALAGSWTSINLSSAISANFSGASGYDVTAVTFDGNAFTPVANVSIPGVFGVDAWTYQATNIAAGPHTLVVTGNLIGGTVGFTGSVNIQAQPVPEPESYALMLAGLAAIGLVVRRRSR